MGIVIMIANLYWVAVFFQGLQASKMTLYRDSGSTYLVELF